jgi:hypothetical protein
MQPTAVFTLPRPSSGFEQWTACDQASPTFSVSVSAVPVQRRSCSVRARDSSGLATANVLTLPLTLLFYMLDLQDIQTRVATRSRAAGFAPSA